MTQRTTTPPLISAQVALRADWATVFAAVEDRAAQLEELTGDLVRSPLRYQATHLAVAFLNAALDCGLDSSSLGNEPIVLALTLTIRDALHGGDATAP